MDLRNPAALGAFLKGDLENALVAAAPGGIEAQEAAGQRALVASFTRLPKAFNVRQEFPREMLKRLGFKIGDEVDGIFVSVNPPPGWSMVATDHSMHSDVLDGQGRKRMGVFYKAAFYDRNAHFRMLTRYKTSVEYRDAASGKWEDGERRAVAMDGDGVIYAEPWQPNDAFKAHDASNSKCDAWLTEKFPDWKNPEAYW